MKKIAYILVSVLLVFGACKPKGSTEKGDFNNNSWGDSFETVTATQQALEGVTYEMDAMVELMYEGDFLGVKPNAENEDEARLSYMFIDKQLKGGWYYIFAGYEVINPATHINGITEKYGNPTAQWDEDGHISNTIWIGERTVVRTLVQDFGDKIRFEWYAYEIDWFNENKATLGLPESF